LIGGLEHLKIETRLIDERFASVMGECVFLKRRRPVKVSCPEEKKKKKKIVSPPEKEACAFGRKRKEGKKTFPQSIANCTVR
jgi:hypothetical protein